MLSKTDFLKSDYKEFKPITRPTAKFALQKTFYSFDMNKIKYFINVYGYDVPKIELRFEVEVQFYRDGETFDLTIHHNNNYTVKSIEKLVESFWDRNNMDYNINN